MGGGGAFRAAAKVAGVTVANSGFRSVTAEHPVYAAARNVARPVSISGISSSSEGVKSGVVKASSGGSSDVSHVQKMFSDFDDWEMAGGEEEMMVNPGEPLPRVVFGGAPSLQEATEATSDLKDALEKSVVASIACDPNVWNAVLQNPALQDFLESQKPSEKFAGASFPDLDQERDESVADTDSFSQSSPRRAFSKSESEEAKSGNSFTSFLKNVKQTVTQTVVDMMNSLSDYFNNLFGGDKFFVDADGSAKFGAAEKTLGASFMALAVMVMMVVISKRSQS